MQPHDHSPLSDFIEYPEEQMLSRSEDFLKTMQRRHSIRHFSDKHVDKAVIRKLHFDCWHRTQWSESSALAFRRHSVARSKTANTRTG